MALARPVTPPYDIGTGRAQNFANFAAKRRGGNLMPPWQRHGDIRTRAGRLRPDELARPFIEASDQSSHTFPAILPAPAGLSIRPSPAPPPSCHPPQIRVPARLGPAGPSEKHRPPTGDAGRKAGRPSSVRPARMRGWLRSCTARECRFSIEMYMIIIIVIMIMIMIN